MTRLEGERGGRQQGVFKWGLNGPCMLNVSLMYVNGYDWHPMLAVIEGQSFVPALCPRGHTRRPFIVVHACGRSCILRVGRRK